VCNPDEARPGEYCHTHSEQLQRLDRHYETLFRVQRTSRGKDHETYNLFLRGDGDPCGRVLVTETDPENLFITVLISASINLAASIAGYDALKIERTFGDQLRDRIRQEIIYSWYGSARACIEVFQTTDDPPLHWDVDPTLDHLAAEEEENPEPQSPQGGKHSVH
jgi:hypothetical protein